VSTAVTFAAIAVTFYAGHHLADHVIGQTDKQSTHKAAPGWHGWRHLLGHVTAYHLVLAAMLATTLILLDISASILGITTGLGFSAVTHAILDRRWPVRWILNHTGSADFANRQTPICGMYLADQSLHYACLWIAALLVACL
jgi:hypothetical protein